MPTRLFFALFPDARNAAKIAARMPRTCREYGFLGRPIPVERLHVTLQHIDDYVDEPPDGLVEALRHAAESIAAKPFPVSFDRALTFAIRKPKRPYVLAGGEQRDLQAFHRKLGDATNRAWPDFKPRRSFTPHVSLIYDEKTVEEHRIKRPIDWTVREFVLVKSFLGQGRYSILGRWPLHDSS